MRKMQMKTRVTDQGVKVPKRILKGVKEVEIRKADGVILVVPVSDDPILALGSHRLLMKLPTLPSITTGSVRPVSQVFLDTGYVLALELSNDQNHRAAVRH